VSGNKNYTQLSYQHAIIKSAFVLPTRSTMRVDWGPGRCIYREQYDKLMTQPCFCSDLSCKNKKASPNFSLWREETFDDWLLIRSLELYWIVAPLVLVLYSAGWLSFLLRELFFNIGALNSGILFQYRNPHGTQDKLSWCMSFVLKRALI